MKIYANKEDEEVFAFRLKNHIFIVTTNNTICKIKKKDFKNKYTKLEEYEILFNFEIDKILENLESLSNCEICLAYNYCSKEYGFLEERKMVLEYLKQLKTTKRIGEFAEE